MLGSGHDIADTYIRARFDLATDNEQQQQQQQRQKTTTKGAATTRTTPMILISEIGVFKMQPSCERVVLLLIY